jgi:uncharacterized membrane protein YeaQ/YmgE (transglycosylase-associated protein family)
MQGRPAFKNSTGVVWNGVQIHLNCCLTPPGPLHPETVRGVSPGRKAFRDEGHLRLKQGIWLMGIDSVIVWLIVGAIAGWLAGLIVKGGGFGLLGNIVIGIVGAVVAGWLLPQLGIRLGTGIVSAIINAAIGGVIVLVILSLIRRA